MWQQKHFQHLLHSYYVHVKSTIPAKGAQSLRWWLIQCSWPKQYEKSVHRQNHMKTHWITMINHLKRVCITEKSVTTNLYGYEGVSSLMSLTTRSDLGYWFSHSVGYNSVYHLYHLLLLLFSVTHSKCKKPKEILCQVRI